MMKLEIKHPKPLATFNPIKIDDRTNEVMRLRDIQDAISFQITTRVADTSAATAANYGVFFITPYPCALVSVSEVHGVAGSDGSAVTLDVEKLTGTTAKGSGTTMLGSTFNLKSTANTVVTKDDSNAGVSQAATSGILNRSLAKGDRVALKTSGTLTAVNDVCVTLTFKTQLSNLPQ